MVMDGEKLTAGAFAESIGVAQATISHILGPRNKYPSTEVILRLHQRYEDDLFCPGLLHSPAVHRLHSVRHWQILCAWQP